MIKINDEINVFNELKSINYKKWMNLPFMKGMFIFNY